MEIDGSGCEVLSRSECLRLLATQSMGRLALHAAALPVILPVAYAVVGDSIVAHIHDRSRLYEAARDSVVAFEADRPPEDDGGGWTVNLTGVAREVTDPPELAELRALPFRRWAQPDGERFLRISGGLLSGRRLCVPVT